MACNARSLVAYGPAWSVKGGEYRKVVFREECNATSQGCF